MHQPRLEEDDTPLERRDRLGGVGVGEDPQLAAVALCPLVVQIEERREKQRLLRAAPR